MTGSDAGLPAWSAPFANDRRDALQRLGPFGRLERSWAFGDGRATGITVAIVDSGVEGSHPALAGALRRSVRVDLAGEEVTIHDDEAVDVVGHGTACASIIHSLAPDASLLSIRVLGPDNRGKGLAFAAGVDWAIEQGATIINLSLSSRSEALFGMFHDLADRAYFAGSLLVCAANNVAVASYPSLFAAVISVAAHDVRDPDVWFYNPAPPVEFGAYGLDVDVAWKGGGRIVATGNSFAAPHIAAFAARIRAAHPTASPAEVKAILAATADATTGAGEPPAT
jgi:subtilisin family serine protease